MSQEATGNGKIERLPWELREQVCRKLRDSVPAAKICVWLNSLPEVLAILDEYFGEQPINAQNVTNFRQGGYQRWLSRQGKLDRTRELAAYAVNIATASGGTLADGASQIIAGNVLEVLEGLEEVKEAGAGPVGPEARQAQITAAAEAIDSLALAVSRLRKGDQNAEALRLARDRIAQAQEGLELEKRKFQRTTCELFVEWYANKKAGEIAGGTASNGEKIEALGSLIFGDLWKAEKK